MRWAPLLLCGSLAVGLGAWEHLARLKAAASAAAELSDAKPRELRRILRERSESPYYAHAATLPSPSPCHAGSASASPPPGPPRAPASLTYIRLDRPHDPSIATRRLTACVCTV